MSIRPLPISTTLDPTIVQDLFDKATHALNKCKYEETIDLTSEAVKRIHQLQLLAVLDHRAYALGMKYKFDDAIKDAERMIVCGPECSGGYLRLGSLLDIQGKSSAAIKVYQQGLDRVLEDDPEYENIVERHKQSKEKNERCVDFITSLPPHVSDYIITLLSLSDKLKWFDVCTAWNKRIMGDESTWSVISAEDAPAISEALSHIARHIEDLTITSESTDIWLEYLNHMKDGYFKKIKTLKLVDRIIAPNATLDRVMLTMAGAFSNVQNTLTKLDFTFVKCEVPLISLSEILLFCKNLNTLIFDALDYADKFIGDHERLEEPHKELVNMEMSTISTTGEALEPLLKKCPKLRRVAMKNCDAKIPDVLYEHCPSLEIFGYEADFADVPQLDDLPQQQQQQENDGEQQPCLREIYTRDGGYGVPAEGIIRLLRKNAKTLKVVFINLYLTAQQKSNNEPHDGIHPDYGEPFKFEQLEKLTYWPDIYGAAEPLLLHAIESCPSLKMFNPAYSTNISQIVDTIKKSPTVEQLELTNVSCYDNLGSDDFMTQLFKAYADETHIPDLNLRTVRFHDSNVITDSVLDALADIKTLEVVKLFDLTRVTTEGLKAFLQKLDKNDIRIKELRLDDLYIVDDAVLRLLPNLKYLESLHLEDLVRITDNGVKYLVDNVKGLHHFKLKHCICISREDMSAYVENSKNIKHFETMHDSS